MRLRNPAVAGSFYPSDSKELRNSIKTFLESVKTEKRRCFGIVAPHAGYEYCGKTAASVYKSILSGFETVVILGPNHTGLGSGIATSSQIWKTPLGEVEPDLDFVKALAKDSLILDDPMSHWREHSIEVQLPWLQYLFKDFKIAPISINPIYFDIQSCKDIGNKIADAVKAIKRKVLLVASSDFTHYGPMYSYEPFRGDLKENLKNVKVMDSEVIKFVVDLNPEKVVEICEDKRLTICGYGGIAAMLYAAKALGARHGELTGYSTSFDASKDASAVVGYAGIAIY
ncbi:MAG: AmmeMemoRadiSam system protein B [Candidatus Aenigmatarchaeota archaeon]